MKIKRTETAWKCGSISYLETAHWRLFGLGDGPSTWIVTSLLDSPGEGGGVGSLSFLLWSFIVEMPEEKEWEGQ